MTISLTPGTELSIVTPSEQTGTEGSKALLYATTVMKYVPSLLTVCLPKVAYVSTIFNRNITRKQTEGKTEKQNIPHGWNS